MGVQSWHSPCSLEKNDKVYVNYDMICLSTLAPVFTGLGILIAGFHSQRSREAYSQDKNTHAGTLAGRGGEHIWVLLY